MHAFRRVAVLVTAAVLAPSATVVASGTAHASPSSAATTSVESGTRPDAVSASAAARGLRRKIEVTGATAPDLRRWANPDGTFTDEVAAGPVRARRGDGWVPIDTTLAASGGALRPAATVGDLAFSDGGDTALASVTDGATSVALTWPRPLPAPVFSGSTARYPNVLPGVDLVLTAVPSGFEQSFVLKTRASAAAALHVPLTAHGMTAASTAHGLVFRDAGGTERAWVGSARMWDASGRTAPVGVAVSGTASSRSLVMTPPASFLDDPSLVFPVTVDPTVQLYRWKDAYIDSVNTTTNYGSNAYLKIGKRLSTTYVTYISFNMSAYAGKHITDAYLYLGATDSLTCNPKTTTVYPVTTTWDPATVTWASHPTTDLGTILATSTGAGGGPVGSTCESNAWVTFHDAALIAKYQAWADSNSTNYGVSVRADATDSLAAKDFASGENGSWTPRVNITYNNYPATVSARSMTPSSSYGGTTYVASTTPTLNGASTDGDGGTTRVDYEIWDNSLTSLVASGSSAYVTAGTNGPWTVPSGSALTDGTTYQWRAKGNDGTDQSKSWSAWMPFTVDMTVPAAPSGIASTQYPQNAWHTSGGLGTFTWTDTSTDVASYRWGIDVTTPLATVTSGSVVVTPGDGWHTLSVRAVDGAGNLGPISTYAFGATPAVTSPVEGAKTQASVSLQSRTANGQSSVTYNYRRASTDSWAAIPAGDVTVVSTGNALTAWPFTWTPGSGDSVPPELAWNVAATLGGVDGPAQVQVCFGTACSTVPVDVTLDQNAFGDSYATAQVGPGTASLLTGNLAVSVDDVSVDAYGSDLALSRTLNSRAPDAVDPENPELLSVNQQGVETDTTGFNPANVTLTRSTTQHAEGASSLKIAPSGTTATDTYANVGGDQNGGFRLGMQAGHSYLFTTRIYVPAATGLTTDRPTRGERAVAFWKDPAGVSYELASNAPTVTDQWVTLSLPFVVPSNATEAWIRLYNGFLASKSSSVVYYDKSSLHDEGAFGLGWTASTPVQAAAAQYSGLVDTGGTVNVGLPDGSAIAFAKTGSTYTVTGDYEGSGLTLTAGSSGTYGPASYTVADLDGDTTAFTPLPTLAHTASVAVPNTYVLSTVGQPGSAQTTTMSYSSGRLSQILAPVPSGSTCTNSANSATWTGACHALQLGYDTNGHLTSVTLAGVDPTAGTPLFVDVACYAYTGHRLTSYWDPRLGSAVSGNHPIACGSPVLATSYSYDSAGRLASVTPPGVRPVNIAYDSSGRVYTVSRTHDASHNGGATETTTVLYGVPIGADPSHPEWRPDMTGAAVDTWAQTDVPATAAVVYGPGDNASPTDLRDGDVTYVDVNGRPVNTASYSGTGAGGWHVATTEYDAHGKALRSLSAANREEALDPTGAAGRAIDLPSDTKAAAAAIDDRTFYSADGLDVTDSYGPLHLVVLDDGTTRAARAHVKTTYDTGSETGHPVGGPMHLDVQSVTTASLSTTADPAQSGVDVDARTTTKAYALDASNAEGWTFRTPLKTVVDPSGLALTSVDRYDPVTGVSTETWQPKASDPATPSGDVDKYKTLTVYYTAGTNSVDASCGNKAVWTNLICKITPKAQPGVSGLPGAPVTTYSYDYLYRPTVSTETVTPAAGGSATRTTTVAYDSSGYGVRVASTTVTNGSGPAVPVVTSSYDSATGLPSSIAAAATAELAATTVSSGYDDFGRVTSYTDADSNVATTTYDNNGRVTVASDAKGSVTYGYSSSTEHRGLPSSLTVSGVTGSFAATYDTQGRLATQTWPNGLVRSVGYDETGTPDTLTYTMSGNTWWTEAVTSSVHVQRRARAATTSSQTYGYDTAARLTSVQDTYAGGCVTRTYGYDADANRTNGTRYLAATDGSGACQSTTVADTVSHGYDPADRLSASGSDTGLAYDTWGRISTLPAADADGAAVTSSHYVNDLLRSQTQGSRVMTWTLDAALRVRGWTDSSTGVTKTNHYDAASDEPSWIAEDGTASTWTRNVSGFDEDLAMVVDQSGTAVYQVADLSGDVVATSSAAATSAPDGGYQETDEFGNERTVDPFGNPLTPAARRYGWLGAKQRSGDDLGRLTLMGVRVYDPQLGRFLQPDPVAGGSANDYDYANQDPTDQNDLGGTMAANAVGSGYCNAACEKQSHKYLKHIKNGPTGKQIYKHQKKYYKRLFHKKHRRGFWKSIGHGIASALHVTYKTLTGKLGQCLAGAGFAIAESATLDIALAGSGMAWAAGAAVVGEAMAGCLMMMYAVD